MGRIHESEAVETLALNGGFGVLLAFFELLLTAGVLAAGVGGGTHLFLLFGWSALFGWLLWRYYQQRFTWTEGRLAMTHAFVEQMVGHRTRRVQAPAQTLHTDEDRGLAAYVQQSAVVDRFTLCGTPLMGQGWLVIGLLGLVPAFVSGRGSTELLAISIGGVLSAALALQRLGGGLLNLAGAAIAWQQIKLLFEAAARPQQIGSPEGALAQEGAGEAGELILQAHELGYRYPSRSQAVLEGCTLEIRSGERILLQGASGGGKSTLAALMMGLRQPDRGLLLLGGLDYQTLGKVGWRRRIAAAPQFHENHILTETFAFNLLMGRRWPPSYEDMVEAEAVCHELGLGDLLERMPGGMLQMVGETGWQLSHGEKSRLYVARAILQQSDLVLLDESFAALDPKNLQRALRCIHQRVPGLVVIAHP